MELKTKNTFSFFRVKQTKNACHLDLKEMFFLSLGQEDPLEAGMATHPSILAWWIPRTEEPGGLQSVGSQSWTRPKRLSTLGRDPKQQTSAWPQLHHNLPETLTGKVRQCKLQVRHWQGTWGSQCWRRPDNVVLTGSSLMAWLHLGI